jgi:hypothetical protein
MLYATLQRHKQQHAQYGQKELKNDRIEQNRPIEKIGL